MFFLQKKHFLKQKCNQKRGSWTVGWNKAKEKVKYLPSAACHVGAATPESDPCDLIYPSLVQHSPTTRGHHLFHISNDMFTPQLQALLISITFHFNQSFKTIPSYQGWKYFLAAGKGSINHQLESRVAVVLCFIGTSGVFLVWKVLFPGCKNLSSSTE